ncbi:ComF family protein [Staphylococcus carnosus]|uniref:ComF family protein n=2 Tax=Staphylococcus carnosus TaxID=1281 RepID=A0AAJ0NHR6_STACA|nr:hypothetical protein VV61_08110 [Staphylococcus carnosus]KOR14160.1 hypothetical protein AMC75_04635 [Staphylococcus carnosus]POA07881.1 ComF family protein [Staphylococcus carnosus]QQS85917.1 ComF family protein [Staphylococcus carnosus]QRQ05852.1 ComF family protein [Staphylococcus carnosus]
MPRCLQCRQKFADPLTAVNFYRAPEILCEKCREGWKQCLLFKSKKHKNMDEEGYCKQCLKPLATHDTRCSECVKLSRRFTLIDHLYCEYQNKDIVKETMNRYRNSGDTALCEVIASQIHLPKKQYDFIVPIPSLIKEDMKRTFNPVTQVLNAKKVSYTNLLVKNRTTGSTAFQGKHNMKNPFDLTQAAHSFNLENKTILLVNDIYTTGVTEHQAAEILFVRKIGKVDVFTFVR